MVRKRKLPKPQPKPYDLAKVKAWGCWGLSPYSDGGPSGHRVHNAEDYKGYVLVEHEYTVNHPMMKGSDNPLLMHCAFNYEGGYIGQQEEAEYLVRKVCVQPVTRDSTTSVCSIGFSEEEQKWYGWSHRAMYGFGVGDVVKEGQLPAEYLPVGFKAETLQDARKMAEAFARSVAKVQALHSQQVGYWQSNQFDKDARKREVSAMIDKEWASSEEAQIVAKYLQAGIVETDWGSSAKCELCDEILGSHDMRGPDGRWKYPEGYEHYILAHGVKPPQEGMVKDAADWDMQQRIVTARGITPHKEHPHYAPAPKQKAKPQRGYVNRTQHSAVLHDYKEYCQSGSIRTKTLTEGIQMVMCKRVGRDKMSAIAIRFDADLFDVRQAKAWLKKHGYEATKFQKAQPRSARTASLHDRIDAQARKVVELARQELGLESNDTLGKDLLESAVCLLKKMTEGRKRFAELVFSKLSKGEVDWTAFDALWSSCSV